MLYFMLLGAAKWIGNYFIYCVYQAFIIGRDEHEYICVVFWFAAQGVRQNLFLQIKNYAAPCYKIASLQYMLDIQTGTDNIKRCISAETNMLQERFFLSVPKRCHLKYRTHEKMQPPL